jgi:hypothetical protein
VVSSVAQPWMSPMMSYLVNPFSNLVGVRTPPSVATLFGFS